MVVAPREWVPPERLRPTVHGKVPGALYGSRLFDAPRHAAVRHEIQAFAAQTVNVEVGFDHGMRILDLARRFPEERWLGLEIREKRVLDARPHAPPNCGLWRADARTIFAAVLAPGRVHRIDVWFPDPVWLEPKRASHLLFTPGFVELCARVLAPGGEVHVATDVDGYFRWIEALFSDWGRANVREGDPLSRRERICKRDGLTVWRAAFVRPAAP